jgi:endogenous inhibitor of DNA gyrase (YacG/DUF329 family)
MKKYEFKCKACGKTFEAGLDHGKPRKFCSRTCFSANATPALEIECGWCSALFISERSGTATTAYEDGKYRRLFCSKQCAGASSRTVVETTCASCGKPFTPWVNAKNGGSKMCSVKCRNEFLVGANAPNYKDGKSHGSSGLLIGLVRPGYVSRYIQNHRLLASQVLKRPLGRNEIVIHINSDQHDDRLENLYLFETRRDWLRARHGVTPWPTSSNLIYPP